MFRTAGCGSCHTLAAARSHGQVGPNLDKLRPSFAAVQTQVEQGGGGMPSFASQLTPAQIRDVAAFVASRAGPLAASQPTGQRRMILPAMVARQLRRRGLATFALLVVMAEVAGRSLTARVDARLHVNPLANSGTSYYPFLLVGLKIVCAFALAALLARASRARAAARPASAC